MPLPPSSCAMHNGIEGFAERTHLYEHRRDVLPAGRDDELLDAAGDAHEAAAGKEKKRKAVEGERNVSAWKATAKAKGEERKTGERKA